MDRIQPSDVSGIPSLVVEKFVQYARDLIKAGFTRYSARAILHRIRWHMQVERGDRGFKCNNNWTPRMSRWFMEQNPQYTGFFEIRASPGNGHDMEDYKGPYTSKLFE
jgi:hypothetical protein